MLNEAYETIAIDVEDVNGNIIGTVLLEIEEWMTEEDIEWEVEGAVAGWAQDRYMSYDDVMASHR